MSNRITITNDKAHPSEEKYKGKIDGSANLHDINFFLFSWGWGYYSCSYHASNLAHTTFINSLTDEKLANNFNAADQSELETVVNETIKEFDASQEGSEEEYKEKKKELEAIEK